MRLKILISSVALLSVVAACANKPPPGTVEKSSNTYGNTFDFVWQSSLEELRSSWQIESEDRAKKTITTSWNVNPAPFSEMGRRDRLIVTLAPSGQGWQATVRQESETNNNQKNPLDMSKAEWETAPNDGGLGAKFLQNLDTRLQPDERWRERLAR